MQDRPSGQAPEKFHDATLLDYIELLLKYKRLIGILTAATFLVSAVVSLILPARYSATAQILPPNESSGTMSTLLSQAEGMLGGLANKLSGNKKPSELYVGIMESRSVADKLIQRFELKELYGLGYNEDVRKKLARRTRIWVHEKHRIISVTVEDSSPKRAADLANAYVDTLDRLNRTLDITENQKKRKFLEERITKVQDHLARAEIALKEFQERHKLVSLEDQAKASIQVAAEIRGKIIAAQTRMEVQRKFGTSRQNEAVKLMAKIEELQRQLSNIEVGLPPTKQAAQNPQLGQSNFFIPIGTLPEMGLKLVRLTREAKIQEKIFELMTTQLELAKMEEAKDLNVIQVLDRAVPPEKRSFPKRSALVMLCTFTAFLCGVVSAFLIEYWRKLQQDKPDQYGLIKASLHESIKAGLRFIIRLTRKT